MSEITLHTNYDFGVTMVSNTFIDTYMPSANGSYIKIYLFLLRCLTNPDIPFSISYIADYLDNTENDVLRALNYWEKEGLLTITQNADGEISELILLEPRPRQTVSHSVLESDTSTAAAKAAPTTENETTDALHVTKEPLYSIAQIEILKEDEEISWLLNVIELYLEQPLTSEHLQLILYLYESLHFSSELIMHLYEYCISKGKRKASYIEAVALAWDKQGIKTSEEAEDASIQYNNIYHAVSKAFGLNRMPGTVEKNFIDKWVNVFGFDETIIVEACNRAILRTQKPDFKYTNKILENWHKQKVTSFQDIKALDDQHNKNKLSMSSGSGKNTTNKFNAFPQRNYTKEEYSSLEKKLLKRSMLPPEQQGK